ncbi:MAG: hypothetical protein S0880_13595 [Actinomycetota bacterium]|nr:hypothetical protein [Actinomycetota bacterium]
MQDQDRAEPSALLGPFVMTGFVIERIDEVDGVVDLVGRADDVRLTIGPGGDGGSSPGWRTLAHQLPRTTVDGCVVGDTGRELFRRWHDDATPLDVRLLRPRRFTDGETTIELPEPAERPALDLRSA